jgi:septum formation protein
VSQEAITTPVSSTAFTTEGVVAPRLFLASRSPQRQALLREAGYAFEIDPADVDEENYPPELLPADVVVHLARAKLASVSQRRPDDVVLAADTLVVLGDTILGKPADAAHADQMLRLLGGTTHIVVSGVAVGRLAGGFLRADRVMSAIRMRWLSDKEIQRYVDSGAWQGKAGGYGIQDSDFHAGIMPAGTEPFLKRIAGCHTNIVGLPMTLTAKLLEAAGVYPQRGK